MTRRETVVFLCECGPIIRDLVDLDALAAHAASIDGVVAVERHATLCSSDGKAFVTERLALRPGARPVFAACSPREHAETLGSAVEAAGVNRYLSGRANIREQCAWVTPDLKGATEKAAHLVDAAAARVARQEPLEPPHIDCETSVLVLGAGLAGMTAALMLADAGRKVTLVEREASIGGRVVLLGELYPDMDCAPCLLEPAMDHVLHHPNIEVLLSSELEELLGYLGNYTAVIRVRPRHVEVDGCYGCRSCSAVCPVSVPDPVDSGMSSRPAVGIPYEGALPNAAVVDKSVCLHFTGGECDLCVGACAFGAIDLDGADTLVERRIGGVVVATGSVLRAEGELWDDPRVMTIGDFERVLNPDGPTRGEIVLPDGERPARIALLHCADATGEAPSPTCSHTCCLSLAKAALEISHKSPDSRVVEFAWDRNLGGPHHISSDAAARLGREVVRPDAGTRVGVAVADGQVRIESVEHGAARSDTVDLVVVAAPQVGSPALGERAAGFGLELDERGFVLTANHRLRSFAARKEGVVVAGSAQGPKDVTAAASHGAAAAGELLSRLVPGTRLAREAATAGVQPELCGGCSLCVLSCPYKAIAFDAALGAAVINELLCHGCGTCAATCPSSAIHARHFTDEQLQAEIEALATAGFEIQHTNEATKGR